MSLVDVAASAPRRGRWRRAAALIRALVSLHPRTFAVAVGGAAAYALFTVMSSLAVQWVTDNVIIARFEDEDGVAATTVFAGLGLLVAIGAARATGVVIRRVFATRTQALVSESLAGSVIDAIAAQPATWHRRRSTGDLVARAGVDVEASIQVLAPLPFATGTVVMVGLAATWMLIVDVPLGLIGIAIFPVFVALNVVYQRRVETHYNAAQDHLGDLSAAVHESFEGVQVVKAFGAERRETDRLATIAGDLRQARTRAILMRATFEALLDALPSLTNVLLVVVGALRVRSGAMSIGELSGFVFLFTLLVVPMRLIGYALSELPRSSAGHARVHEVAGQPAEPDPRAAIGVAPPGVGLRLAEVSAGHDAAAVLRDIDLMIAAGRTVAVVGATGSGKSTLLQVIAGVIAPTSGAVARQAGPLSVVFQEPFLLAASVRENVTMGHRIDDDAVWRALAVAEARSFVEQLADGLDTLVGERGVSLSGGQRQRVALARAVAREPAVLLLDDTTSALDPATEARVLDNLERAFGDSTVLIVASRPSTIALADEVVFLRDGSVVAHGSHGRLLADQPAYRQLVEAFETDRAQGDAAASERAG